MLINRTRRFKNTTVCLLWLAEIQTDIERINFGVKFKWGLKYTLSSLKCGVPLIITIQEAETDN
jgi:hypothetical protein